MDLKGVTSGMNIFPRMLRIMRISDCFGIPLYKLTRNGITITLTSCLWANKTRIASSLILHALVTEGWTPNKRKRSTSILISWELWKMKSIKVVPVVIGALGTILKRLEDHLRNIKLLGYSWHHFKEQTCRDKQGSSKEFLKSEAAFCDLVMGLKFLALTYLLWCMHHNNDNDNTFSQFKKLMTLWIEVGRGAYLKQGANSGI